MHTIRRVSTLAAFLTFVHTACVTPPKGGSQDPVEKRVAKDPLANPESAPADALASLPEKVTLQVGQVVRYRLQDGTVAQATLSERWVEDSSKVIELALGGTVVRTERERDSPVVHIFSPAGEPSVIAIETIGGGPGTCVWMKEVRVYSAAALVEFAADKTEPAGTSIELGAYLDCEDGTPRSCGCGTWEAAWSAAFEGGVLKVTTTPKTTYKSEDKAPVAPPKGDVVAVPVR